MVTCSSDRQFQASGEDQGHEPSVCMRHLPHTAGVFYALLGVQ